MKEEIPTPDFEDDVPDREPASKGDEVRRFDELMDEVSVEAEGLGLVDEDENDVTGLSLPSGYAGQEDFNQEDLVKLKSEMVVLKAELSGRGENEETIDELLKPLVDQLEKLEQAVYREDVLPNIQGREIDPIEHAADLKRIQSYYPDPIDLGIAPELTPDSMTPGSSSPPPVDGRPVRFDAPIPISSTVDANMMNNLGAQARNAGGVQALAQSESTAGGSGKTLNDNRTVDIIVNNNVDNAMLQEEISRTVQAAGFEAMA
jgi:hypothetical protein